MNEAAAAKRLKPTTRQLEILNYIRGFIFDTGYSPTQVEIRDHFKWKSTNAVTCHIKAMKAKELITFELRHARTIRITTKLY